MPAAEEAAALGEAVLNMAIFHEVVFHVKARLRPAALRRTRSPWLGARGATHRARLELKPTAWSTVNTPKPAVSKRLTPCKRIVSRLPRTCSPTRNSTTGLIPIGATLLGMQARDGPPLRRGQR